MRRRDFLWQLAAGLASPPAFAAQSAAGGGFQFVDVTASAGLTFRHNNGAYGGKLLPETLGSGCAFLDYDNDGWQDILLVNGADWPGHHTQRSTLRLYRNNRNGTFTDVTRAAGLEVEMYGMGVAVGDFNNDGFPDVVFQNTFSGQLAYWLLNGVTEISAGNIQPTTPGAGWSAVLVWTPQSIRPF